MIEGARTKEHQLRHALRDIEGRLAAVARLAKDAAFRSDGVDMAKLGHERARLLEQRDRAFLAWKKVREAAVPPVSLNSGSDLRKHPLYDARRGILTRDLGRVAGDLAK